jgi:hypothetical protein
MVLTCARRGFGAAWRRPGLAILLWAWSLILSLPLALPAWSWLLAGTSRAPETDLLLQRFSFAALADLVRTDPSIRWLVPAFVATALVAIVGQALAGGGLIEVLTAEDERPFPHRFFRGAGHFFWRFLRVGVYAWIGCGVAVALIAMAFEPLSVVLGELVWEPAAYLGLAVELLLVAAALLLVTIAFDFARIRMALDDSRRALRSLFSSLWFVISHPIATGGVFLVVAVALTAVYAAYAAFRASMPSNSWGLILLMAVAQQLTVIAAAWLRVALLGGELAVWERLAPPVASAPAADVTADSGLVRRDALQHDDGGVDLGEERAR